MKCTFLRNLSLKSFVASAVFSFSLVVACISPVFADTVPISTDPFTVYVGVPGSDPYYQGKPFTLPVTESSIIQTYTKGSYNWEFGFNWISYFQPFDYDTTFVYSYAFMGTGFGDTSGTTLIDPHKVLLCAGSSSSFRNGINSTSSSNYSLSHSDNYAVWSSPSSHYSSHYVSSVILPAGTNAFCLNERSLGSTNSPSSDFAATLLFAYLIHSADPDIVNQVNAILDEVKKVNGNLTSALSVLNQILDQCQGIKADTASIVSILGLCKDQLVSLNGKVDDIYKLLKDSLATESQALDQKSENVADQIMQRTNSEQYWSDKNTENFNALDMGNWSFGDGVVGALPTVGNLFKSLWDSIGDATLIFVFPLMLGIALVIVGRLSRTSGKGSKKGGGDDG